METERIKTLILDSGGTVEDSNADTRNLSSILLRGEWEGEPFVGVGSERSTEEKIGALIDALHWCRVQHSDARELRFVIAKGDESRLRRGHRNSVLEPLATLIAARGLKSKPHVKIMPNGKPTDQLPCPTFVTDVRVEGWMKSIKKRLEDDPEPKLVSALSKALRDYPSFRWYRGVTANYWSGRVEGLEVCRIKPHLKYGILGIGTIGTKGERSKAGKLATDMLAGAPSEFTESDIPLVSSRIRDIAVARQSEGLLKDFQPEHRLEALVLRNEIPIPAGNGSLKPVFGERPFQFPALWCTDGLPRYIDVLMYEGNIPWIIELKDTKYGPGQYYRHAISQAVLYREFVRKAPSVKDLLWSKKKLIATECKALVAFPDRESNPIDPSQLKGLQSLARDFDVEMVTV
jgi:hypothetical protein